jgi:hypothetical protein
MPTDPVSNMSYAPTGFSPADIFAQDWPPFTLTKDEIAQLARSAPDELRNIVATGSGASTITSLSFQFRSVALVRPWLSTDVFKARFWKFRDGTPPLSDGATSPQGSWPAHISAVVLARNIVITTQAAPKPQPLQYFAVSPAMFRPAAVARATPVQETEGIGAKPAATPRSTRGLASPGMMTMRPMTPIVAAAPPVAPQIARVSPVMRLIGSTYRTRVYQPTGVSSSASPGKPPSQPQTGTVNTDVSILAFICRRLPQTPNPDPSLTW